MTRGVRGANRLPLCPLVVAPLPPAAFTVTDIDIHTSAFHPVCMIASINKTIPQTMLGINIHHLNIRAHFVKNRWAARGNPGIELKSGGYGTLPGT